VALCVKCGCGGAQPAVLAVVERGGLSADNASATMEVNASSRPAPVEPRDPGTP
jgi:hypothetical protein